MKLRKLGFGVALAIAVLGASAWGADPIVPQAWPVAEARKIWMPAEGVAADTERLVKELGAGDFSVRERASKELAEKGGEAFPGLREKALATNDPEVVARITDALSGRQVSVPANLPKNLAGALAAYEGQRQELLSDRNRISSASSLSPSSGLEYDQRDQRAIWYGILLSQEMDPRFRKLLQQGMIGDVGPTLARVAIVQGDFDSAESLLRQSLARIYDGPACLANLIAMRRGDQLRVGKELDAIPGVDDADNKDSKALQKKELEYFLLRAARDKAADGRAMTFEEADWSRDKIGLMDDARVQEIQKCLGMSRGVSGYDFNEGLVYMLKGDRARGDAFVLAQVQNPSNGINGGLLQNLIKADHTELAIAFAGKQPELEFVGQQLLCKELRVREALAAIPDKAHVRIEVPLALLEMGFEREARNLLLVMKPDESKAGVGELTGAGMEFDLASALEMVGENRLADEWRTRAIALVEGYDAKRREMAIQYEKLIKDRADAEATGRSFDFYGQAMPLSDQQHAWWERSRQQVSFRFDMRVAKSDAPYDAGVWLQALDNDLSLDSKAKYEMVFKIIAGDVPGEQLMKIAMSEPLGEPYRHLGIDLVCKRLRLTGRGDLATKLVMAVYDETRDPTCLQALGDWALEKGDGPTAVKWYEKAAVFNLTDGSLMYRLALACDKVPDRKKDVTELKAFAPMLVLGDRDEARRLADVMRKFDGKEAGDTWYDDYVERFCEQRPGDYTEHLIRMRDAAERRGDYAEALAWHSRAMFIPMQGGRPYYLNFVTYPADYHRLRVLDGLARGDFGAVVDGLAREMENGPPDVDLLEKALPVVRKGGGAAEREKVEQVLATARGRLGAVVEDYPEVKKYVSEWERLKALSK